MRRTGSLRPMNLHGTHYRNDTETICVSGKRNVEGCGCSHHSLYGVADRRVPSWQRHPDCTRDTALSTENCVSTLSNVTVCANSLSSPVVPVDNTTAFHIVMKPYRVYSTLTAYKESQPWFGWSLVSIIARQLLLPIAHPESPCFSRVSLHIIQKRIKRPASVKTQRDRLRFATSARWVETKNLIVSPSHSLANSTTDGHSTVCVCAWQRRSSSTNGFHTMRKTVSRRTFQRC